MQTDIKPLPHQIQGAIDAKVKLDQYGIAYFSWEERSGKTLSSIVACELYPFSRVLIVTKKAALTGWKETLSAYGKNCLCDYELTSYSMLHKLEPNSRFDIVVVDEAHTHISGYPKPSKPFLQLREACRGAKIIYLSATPHAQGFSLLFHQFGLSDRSPWRHYVDFYEWFREYGIPKKIYVKKGAIDVYHDTHEDRVFSEVFHLFLSKRRQKDLNFKHEPQDVVHYVELSADTRRVYNLILKDKKLENSQHKIVYDSEIKKRIGLHMLEGGTLKNKETRIILPNKEKINYILKTWGDTKDLCIMYNYQAELPKLKKYFKKAIILQATTYAEGVDLSHIETIVLYSHDFSTSRFVQRRCRQAHKDRKTPINFNILLVKDGISEHVYTTVSINRKNYVTEQYEKLAML